ncbi:MAG: hypothetical protein KGJ23_11245 [Euryarchaeota archaeon]|nr:hypothetical protein [Euryarchaeota archaeon]MDE1837169.1 hypothetical protein [Euryarchaeota archaeon]MDE1881493.1 hypothetical protein [Euryarchaeota archaeon]MDE2045325.1 hypothetical protein [Thermoplasmata archaeon]
MPSSSDPEAWVVFKTGHPSYGTTILPLELAEALGLPPVQPKGERPDPSRRSVAFLDRGDGRLRVISVSRSPMVLAAAISQSKVVSQIGLSDKLYFNLPAAVESFLSLKGFRDPENHNRVTDEVLAWLMPAEEYYTFREAKREEKPPLASLGGPAHVYLMKSHFPGLLPPLKALEEGEEEVAPRPVAPLAVSRPARKVRA